jgi:hypothetical protein
VVMYDGVAMLCAVSEKIQIISQFAPRGGELRDRSQILHFCEH